MLQNSQRPRWQRVYLVVDCDAAIRAIEGRSGFDYAFKLRDVRDLRRKLSGDGTETRFIWTPSHDKKPNWRPEADLCPLQLRALNRAADEAAGACMHRRCSGSLRQVRARRVREASHWECKALQAVAAIGQAYHAHLITPGTPAS